MASINQSTVAAGSLLDQAYGDAARIANQTSDLTQQRGLDLQLVSQTAGLAEVQAQNQSLKAATALGTNPEDAAYMLGQLASTIRDTYQQRDQAILATQQAGQVNMFKDGPMAWLGAQLDLPMLQQQQQVSEARYANATDMYSRLNNLTQESTRTFNNIAQTKTITSVEAQANAIVAEANAQANAARIEGLKLNAAGITAAQNMRQTVFDNDLRVQAAGRDAERLTLAKQEAADRAKARKDNEKDIGSYVESINVARTAMGLPTYDVSQVRVRSNTANGKAELDRYFENGLIMSATGKQIVGNTPAAAMQFMATHATAQPSPGTLQLLKDVSDYAGSKIAGGGDAVKNPKNIPSFVDKEVTAQAAAMRRDVSTKGNWYAPPPLASIVDDEIRNLKVVRTLVDPALAAGETAYRPEILFPQALEEVRQGKMSLQDAITGIGAISRKAVAYNNGYRNYEGIGLPAQTGLPMKMENTGPFKAAVNDVRRATQSSPFSVPLGLLGGTTRTLVDLTDDVALSRYANMYLSGQFNVNLQAAAAQARKTKP